MSKQWSYKATICWHDVQDGMLLISMQNISHVHLRSNAKTTLGKSRPFSVKTWKVIGLRFCLTHSDHLIQKKKILWCRSLTSITKLEFLPWSYKPLCYNLAVVYWKTEGRTGIPKSQHLQLVRRYKNILFVAWHPFYRDTKGSTQIRPNQSLHLLLRVSPLCCH